MKKFSSQSYNTHKDQQQILILGLNWADTKDEKWEMKIFLLNLFWL